MSERDEKARRALALNAHRGTQYSSDAEVVNAFLTRYGTAADIAVQVQHVEQLREFMTKHVGERIAAAAGDGEALAALAVVEARLRELLTAAEQYKWMMDLLGWTYVGATLKYAPPKNPGRKKTLETMTITALFNRMTAEGWPRSNNAEVHEHIRNEMLARGFHPETVTTAFIKTTVNVVLYPNRHYKKKKKT
jgi:hypothetical protein